MALLNSAGSGRDRGLAAARLALPADRAHKVERLAEKKLFWRLSELPEHRSGSGLDYTRIAAAFNQEAADQAVAVYHNERQPLNLQDTLRHTDAQRPSTCIAWRQKRPMQLPQCRHPGWALPICAAVAPCRRQTTALRRLQRSSSAQQRVTPAPAFMPKAVLRHSC